MKLQNKGLKVWYAEFTLMVGDSLRRSIDRGLAESRFGIVVLSPSFFEKEWPQRELDGLTAREISTGKVILPIWHHVSREEFARYSPVLADRLAVSTSRGLDFVVAELLRAIDKVNESENNGKIADPIDDLGKSQVSSTHLEDDQIQFLKQVADNDGEFPILESAQIGEWVRVGSIDYADPPRIRIKYLDMVKSLQQKGCVDWVSNSLYRITDKGYRAIEATITDLDTDRIQFLKQVKANNGEFWIVTKHGPGKHVIVGHVKKYDEPPEVRIKYLDMVEFLCQKGYVKQEYNSLHRLTDKGYRAIAEDV